MTTALDSIKVAMREIGALESGETPTDAEANDCLDKLNKMVASWELDGMAIFTQAWTLTTEIPLPLNHIGAIEANLAVQIAPMFGGAGVMSPLTLKQADGGYRALQAAYGKPFEMTTDRYLRGSYQRYYWGY